MKLIKFFIALLLANTFVHAMESKKEQLPKPDLNEKQFEQESEKLKEAEELNQKAGKDIIPPKNIQKIIAQKMIAPYLNQSRKLLLKLTQWAQYCKFSMSYSAYSPDGRMSVTEFKDKAVWIEANGKRLCKLDVNYDSLNYLVFSNDNAKLATLSNNYRDALIWDTTTGKQLYRLKLGKEINSVRSLIFSSNGTNCAGRFIDGVLIWNLETGKQLPKFKLSKDSDVVQVYFQENEEKALQWLTNKLPGQKIFLLPDQAEIIRRACESKLKDKKLAITGVGAAKRYNMMPKNVRNLLEFYLGVHVDAKLQSFLDRLEKQKKRQQLLDEIL